MIRARRLWLGLWLGAVSWRCFWQQTAVDEGLLAFALLGVAILLTGSASDRRLRLPALALLGFQAVLAPGWVEVTAGMGELPRVAALYAGILRMLGEAASATGGMVAWRTGGLVNEVRIGFATLGGFSLGLWLFSLVAALSFFRVAPVLSSLVRVVAAVCLGGLLRFFVLLVALPDLPDNGVLTSTLIEFVTVLPLVALAPRAWRVATPSRSVGGLLRPAMAGLAALAWVLALGWNPVGEPKAGRILIDGRGDWERLDTPFGPEDWGQEYAYAYSNLRETLERAYAVQIKDEGQISAADLAGTDVLILRTPVSPFSRGEQEAIWHFVREGGGLFLVGDHTDLFGMTTYMNDVARLFDIQFRSDDTFDLYTEGFTTWEVASWLPHPVGSAIGRFEFETSCTLEVPIGTRVPVMGYAMGADPADFSKPGFFGDLHLSANERFGFLPQLAVLPYGAGRVAAVADSTPFSNFSIYFPGRREMLLATVDWLNRESGWFSQRLAWLGLVVSLGFGVGLLVDRRSRFAGSFPAVMLGLALGTAVVWPQRSALLVGPPPPEVLLVGFDQSISDLQLPSSLRQEEAADMATADSFFMTTQRLGAVPQVVSDLEDLPEGLDMIVLIRPSRVPTEAQLDALQRFVIDGGALLVVDGWLNPGEEVSSVLARFGVERSIGLETVDLDDGSHTSSGAGLMAWRPEVSLLGVDIKLRTLDGNPVYGERDYGEGRVGVFLGAEGLTPRGLGSRFMATPDASQQRAVTTILGVLRGLSGLPDDASRVESRK